MAWPTSVAVDTDTYSRENCSDGYVYRVAGVQNPHITIHGVRNTAVTVSFDSWVTSGGGFHLRYYGTGKLWEYNRGEPDPFMIQGRGKGTTTNKGAEEPQANALAKTFWTAIQALR